MTAAHMHVPPYHHHTMGGSSKQSSKQGKGLQELLEQRRELSNEHSMLDYITEEHNPSQIKDVIKMLGGPEGSNALGVERNCLENLCLLGAKIVYPFFNFNRLVVPTSLNTEGITTRVPSLALFGLEDDSPSSFYLKFWVDDSGEGAFKM